MSRMYPKQAVDIVTRLLDRHHDNPSEGPLQQLSPRQVEAVAFLVRFVDEVRQARDLVRVVERLFAEGIIYPADPKPTRVRSPKADPAQP